MSYLNSLSFKSIILGFVSLAVVLPISSLQAKSDTKLSPVDFHKVIVLKPGDFKGKMDQSNGLDAFSLVAVKNGQIEAIPFQFDEMTTKDYVYIEAANTELLGRADSFDENDELLFMYRDAGSKKGKLNIADGKLIAEIEIKLEGGSAKYVYLVKDARLRSDANYVRYSSQLGRTETDYYYLEVNKKNAYLWEEFYFNGFEGADPGRPLDTIKLNGVSKILGGLTIKTNNKHMVAKVLAEKVGPIRATTTFKATLTYFKAPVYNTELQIRHYENKIVYDSIFNIPTLRRKTLTKATVRLTMDGNNLEGAKASFAHDSNTIASIDGGLSSAEERLMDAVLSGSDNLWAWVETEDNFSLMSIYKFEQIAENLDAKKKESKKYDVVVYPWIEDSMKKQIKPEYYKGQSPTIGYEVDLPMKGGMRFRSSHNMFSKTPSGSASDIAAQIQKHYTISVK